LRNGLIIAVGSLLAIAAIIFFPWLTFISIKEVATSDFDIGAWFATLWLLIVFGGATAAVK
jgi:hypothetical protein